MNARQLYEQIKAALNYFDIPFNRMDLMNVTFNEGAVTFEYKGASIRREIEE